MATPRTLEDLAGLALRRGSSAASPATRGRFDPLLVGLLAALVSGAALWRPSLWFDEVATRVATERPLGQLAELVTRVDLVHGAYYALLHPWVALVGSSPAALRAPSAVAAGLAAAGVVVLGRQLGPRRYALLAGLVFALLPRVTWMGAEARSVALVTALVTWWTVALLAALRRGGRLRWVVHGVLGVAATVVFVYAGLLVAAHVASVLLARRRLPPPGWWPGALAVSATTLTLGAAAAGQYAQVSWLPPIGTATVWFVGLEQFFPGARLLAAVAWVLVAVAVVTGLRGRSRRATPRAVPGPVQLALPWLVVPPVLLVGASLVGDPVYFPRYVAFTSGAVALLVALPLSRWRPGWRPTVAVLVLAGLAAPAWVAQRQVSAKADYAVAAEQVQRLAEPGDVVLWTPLDLFPADTRVLAEAHPEAFSALRDPTAGAPRSAGGGLWTATLPPTAADLEPATGVLVVRDLAAPPAADDPVRRLLAEGGFVQVARWAGPMTEVVRFGRPATAGLTG